MMETTSRVARSAHTKWHRLVSDQSGSMLALLAVLPVLAGAVAIGIETGQLYRMKRQMQSSSDAGALAGAIDRMAGKSTAVITATAQYEAQRNGFTDGANGVSVAVNAPPTTGSNIGTTGAVEVIITKSMGFSLGAAVINMLGGSAGSFTISARSVAAQSTTTTSTTTTTTGSNQEACLIALTPNNEQGISLTSFNNLTSDCSIMSNATATGTGSSASINMSSFNSATLKSVWTRGSFAASSYNRITLTDNGGVARTNQTGAIYDPYSGLSTPSPGACTYTNYQEPSGSSLTLSPGTYCGGLTVQNKSNVYFTAGTYYIVNGDLVIRSDNNVSCSDCATSGGTTTGTTFVLTQNSGSYSDIGGISITSMNNVSLNAPSTGAYQGVLFYQDPNVPVGTMTSSSKIFTIASLNSATLAGAIYFPNNRIDISSVNNFGGTSTNGCTIWIGRYLKFSSFNNSNKGGCSTYGTTPAGLTVTTTTTNTTTVNKGKVVE